MSLGPDDVKRIAYLARLSIDEGDISEYAKNLSNILEMVEQMDSVDTGGVDPMAHPQDATQRLRPDEVSEEDRREVFQTVAPRTEAGLYLVPKVIE